MVTQFLWEPNAAAMHIFQAFESATISGIYRALLLKHCFVVKMSSCFIGGIVLRMACLITDG